MYLIDPMHTSHKDKSHAFAYHACYIMLELNFKTFYQNQCLSKNINI